MKFQVIFSIFLPIFFLIEVSFENQQDESKIPTAFIGLKGDTTMGHIGYMHVSTDSEVPEFELSSCKNLDPNETMCRMSLKISNDEGSILFLRAWTAATLRENILFILGYLLHQYKVEFREDVDSSLKLIYDQVRLNNVKIMEVLPRLKAIVSLNKSRRSVALFRALQLAMPAYCRSAAEEVARSFFRLTNIMISKNNSRPNPASEIGMYITANIDPKVFPLLRTKGMRRASDKFLTSQFGREYAVFFSAIQHGKIPLTQRVLGVLMMLTRFGELSAHENEDLKYLIDSLLLKKIPGWLPRHHMNVISHNNPYILIKIMMQSLANHSVIDPVIKSIAINFQTRLDLPHRSARSKPMFPFFQKPELNITMIMELLEAAAPIPEVRVFWDMIENHTINLNYALKGFNRYFYDTRQKFVLAFVRRVQHRIPMDKEIYEYIQNIIDTLVETDGKKKDENDEDEHTKFKRNTYNGNNEKSYPDFTDDDEDEDDDDDDDDDEDDYTQTSISQSCGSADGCLTMITNRRVVSEANETFSSRRFDSNCPKEPQGPSLSTWLKSLDDPVKNIEPSSLITNVSTVLKIFMDDPTINKAIKNIIGNQSGRKHSLNNAASNLNLSRHTSRSLHNSSEQYTVKENEKLDRNNKRSASIQKQKKRNLLKYILKEMLSMTQVRARSVVYYEVMRVYCLLIHNLVNHKPTTLDTDLHLDKHQSNDIIVRLLKIISQPFKELINDKNLMKNLSSNNFTREPITNRHFLIDLCQKLLTLPTVKNHDDLFNEIIFLLHEIQDRPMKFTQLMMSVASPAVNNFSQFHVIYNYLTKPKLLHALGDDFDIGRYPTKGRLLKAMMEKVLHHPSVVQDTYLSQAIQSHIPKVICYAFGAEPSIELLLAIEPERINIRRVMRYGVDKTKFDPNFEETLFNMWELYSGPFMVSSRSTNSTVLQSRANLIEGLLNITESNIERDYTEVKKNIAAMRSAILKTGNGSAPVDYI